MPLEPDDSPDPLAVALHRVDDPAGALRLPGGLAAYARQLTPPTVEARAREVLAALDDQPRHRVKPAVTIAQLVDHLAVHHLPIPPIVLVALATAMVGNVRARRWIVATLGVEAATPLLGVSPRTLRRAKVERVDDDDWRTFDAIARGDVTEATMWAMVRALGLVQDDPASRKRGNVAALTRGAMQALHGGLDDPAPFIAASVADAVPLNTYEALIEHDSKRHAVSVAAQSRAAHVDRATIRDWRSDPKLDTAYRLNQMHDAAFANRNKASSERLPNPAAERVTKKYGRDERTK